MNGGKKDNIIPRKKFNKIGINTVYFAINDNLINMSFLFNNCSSLKEIYFNSFETDITTNMKAMFQNCSNLENLIYQILIHLKLLIWPKCLKDALN